MHYRPLGKTGLNISTIAVGTAALGLDYGIEVPGDFRRPAENDATRWLQDAADAGVNLFDTAPAYGESERLLGQALGERTDCYFATKVPVPGNTNGCLIPGSRLRHVVQDSVKNSLRALHREVLDIMQIHNATVDVIARGEMAEALLKAKSQGKVRFLGATVYTEAEALAVIEAGCFDVLQVAYNVLDQRMAARVFPAAARAGIGLIVRSTFLKGALTPRAQWLPPELTPLRQAAERAMEALAGSWESLPEVALRFSFSAPPVATVLVGVGALAELKQALKAVEAGPLPTDVLAQTPALALRDDRLLNPSYWSVP